MRIIDNKKDYYDYLVGVWGMDEKITYDRRGSQKYDKIKKDFPDNYFISHISLKIGDYLYAFTREKETGIWILPKKVNAGSWYQETWVDNPVVITDDSKLKSEHPDCPIVLHMVVDNLDFPRKYYYDRIMDLYIENPILSTFGFISKYIDPLDVWNKVYSFLSSKYDKQIVDNRTNKEHIESAGFDNKISFRNVK